MTDTDKLKRLADEIAAYPDWIKDDILALIAENGRLSGALKAANDGFEKHERLWYLAKDERDEAVALLRKAQLYVSLASYKDSDMAYNRARDENGEITNFLARIDAWE